MADKLVARRMTGRCATGSERDGGWTCHVVPSIAHPSWTPALCGATPGRRGNGWSAVHGAEVTCARCTRKMLEMAADSPATYRDALADCVQLLKEVSPLVPTLKIDPAYLTAKELLEGADDG